MRTIIWLKRGPLGLFVGWDTAIKHLAHLNFWRWYGDGLQWGGVSVEWDWNYYRKDEASTGA